MRLISVVLGLMVVCSPASAQEATPVAQTLWSRARPGRERLRRSKRSFGS